MTTTTTSPALVLPLAVGTTSTTTTTTEPTAPAYPPFPGAGASEPKGAIVSFSGNDYVFAGGRVFAIEKGKLASLHAVDHAKVTDAPSGTAAPTGLRLRVGTLLTTQSINGNPTIYVVGHNGELYGFASAAQMLQGGFDPALVVTVTGL